ncbi:MAG: hypothetical protein WCO28_11665 [Bacteroidota bacterium]
MKKLFCLIFCFGYFAILFAQSNTPNAKTAIGKTYKRIDEIIEFKNFREWEGVVISDLKEKNKIFSKISDGKNTMVLLTEYYTKGYKILAILDLGKIEKNIRIILRDCRVNSKTDGFIVALVKEQNKAYFTNITRAWKFDQNTNSFIEIPTKGIDCFNDEFENQ